MNPQSENISRNITNIGYNLMRPSRAFSERSREYYRQYYMQHVRDVYALNPELYPSSIPPEIAATNAAIYYSETFGFGITKKQIKRNSICFKFKTPKRKRSKNSKVEEKTENTTCSICLEQFSANITVRRLGCMHLFHIKCIDKWLQSKHQCPICRTPVVVDYKNLFQFLESGQTVENFWNDASRNYAAFANDEVIDISDSDSSDE